jgi:hypothetical protein
MGLFRRAERATEDEWRIVVSGDAETEYLATAWLRREGRAAWSCEYTTYDPDPGKAEAKAVDWIRRKYETAQRARDTWVEKSTTIPARELR